MEMGRILAFFYGLLAYVVFLAAFLYAIGFIAGLVVPKTIDTGAVTPVVNALVIDILLLSLFAVQHSVMAGTTFKRWWTQFVPAAIERSIRASCQPRSDTAFLAVAAHTRDHLADNKPRAMALVALSFVGWFIVLLSTFLINHFELFGLRQVINHLAARTAGAPRFKTPFLYKIVRHPIYLGFIVAFWATPAMTAGQKSGI
jgi:methanethiol S-methyltransferase